MVLVGKESACQCKRPRFDFLGREDPLEKDMAIHSSILAWKIPWIEEPGGLYSPWGRKELDMTVYTHTQWYTYYYISEECRFMSTQLSVMVNFIYKLNWATNCPDIRPTIILAMSLREFLVKMNT